MYENYLTHIMKELRRSSDGKVPNAKEMFRQGEQPLTTFSVHLILTRFNSTERTRERAGAGL